MAPSRSQGYGNYVALNYNPNATQQVFSSCDFALVACTDSTAINFDALGRLDDGSCEPRIEGCTDNTALNFDSRANAVGPLCAYAVLGCADSRAAQYDPAVTHSIFGSCTILGCTDSTALK